MTVLKYQESATVRTLRELADEAERRGGCAEGVEWGRTHDLSEVADSMLPAYAAWMLGNTADILGPVSREAFLAATKRDVGWACQALALGHIPANRFYKFAEDVLRDLEQGLLATSRSLAISLKEVHGAKLGRGFNAVFDRVIEAQRDQIRPGVLDGN